MMAMSRSGRGNGYYSETADSLLERFREEFSPNGVTLCAPCAVAIEPLAGNSL